MMFDVFKHKSLPRMHREIIKLCKQDLIQKNRVIQRVCITQVRYCRSIVACRRDARFQDPARYPDMIILRLGRIQYRFTSDMRSDIICAGSHFHCANNEG